MGVLRARSHRVTYRDVTISVTDEGVVFDGTPFRTKGAIVTTIEFKGIMHFKLETYRRRDKSVYRVQVNGFRFWTRDKSWFDIIDEKVKALGNLRRREIVEYRHTRYTIPRIIESLKE